MRIIKPEVKELVQEDLFKHIELCGRTCYKSEDRICEGSAEKFVNMLRNHAHGAMLEHGTVYLIIPEYNQRDLDGKKLEYKVQTLTKNKYTKIVLDDEGNYHITTNYRVIVENDLEDLMNKYNTEPSIFHCRRRTFRITCNRGVSHEFVRHRVFSFAHECLAGDTIIHPKGYTIAELYQRFNFPETPQDKTHNKTLRLKSCNDNNIIVYNKPLEILYKGKAPVYEVKTQLGYSIKTTLNHKFLSENGDFKKLSDLSVGDYVSVNGRPSLVEVSDSELLSLYETMDTNSIAQFLGCPATSVRRKLKELCVFEKRKNDSNKEKYLKNHIKETYKKGGSTRKRMYDAGELCVWNKGLTKDTDDRVKHISELMVQNHYKCVLYGKDNPNYKNGMYTYRNCLKNVKTCQLCGSDIELEVHHIDLNRENNDKSNLIKLFTKCHHIVHSTENGKLKFKGIKCIKDKIISIKFAGVEDVYDVCMEEPLNNYVANGFVVHNSQRYVNYTKDKFGKEIKVIKPLYFEEGSELYAVWRNACERDEEDYFKLIELGATPEKAREVLPNSCATELIMTGFEEDWQHFFDLRCAHDAHPQAQEVANMIRELFLGVFDEVFRN